MSLLLPDDYMNGHSLDDLSFEQVPEIGYDDCHPHNPFFEDLSQGLAAWHQDHHTSAPQQSFASEDLGPVAGLAHSAPVYYHHNHSVVMQQQQPIVSTAAPAYVAHQPAPHYINQQHTMSQSFQVPHRQPTADGYDSYSECSEVSSSYGSYSSIGAPISTERPVVDNGFRVRVRNTSAPPTPLLQHFPQNAHFAQPQTPMRPTWGHGHYNLSASYGDQPGAPGSYQEPPTMGFSEEHSGTYRRQPVSSPRQNARRRPSNVPALAFGTLSLNHGQALAPYSPASLPPMSPHSPQSQASMSDPDSPGSNASTPRSSTTTPRSTTSTPRSMSNEKKRSRSGAPHPLERERRVRPKVVAEKGALQCKGLNRKKNARCRNAALMEYIGPRPLYCAEHITLDPESFYSKCSSSYHKVLGDGKGCREVVLKELEFCHKHYSQAVDVLLNGTPDGFQKARAQFNRISFLLAQLETEATAAKRTDPDLFQRKHKLIPKFMEMKKLLHKRLVDCDPSLKFDEVDTSVNIVFNNINMMSYMMPKVEESAETPKDMSSSTTTSPSETSEDVCTYDEPSVMMQVEQRHYPVY